MAANGNAPEYGNLVEQWACDALYLDYVDDTHYDAVTVQGRRVQIKGAMLWVDNGYDPNGNQAQCRGRFKFYEGDHDALVADDGVYLLVVYDTDDDTEGIEALTAAYFTPEEVADVVDGDWYSEGDFRERSKGLVYRTTWNSFLEVDDD